MLNLFRHLLFQHPVFSQELSEPLNSTSVLSGADTVSPLPTASFTITNNQACMGGIPAPFIFNNFTTNATSYQWDFGDGTPMLNTTSTAAVTHTYTIPGQFVVILTATNTAGCCDKYSLVTSVTPTTANYNPNCCSFTTNYVQDPSDGDYSFDITTTQLWNPPNTLPVRDTIRVHPPAVLTITTTVEFGPWGKIIVEEGAQLVLKPDAVLKGIPCIGPGGTISVMWQGIEVWGNAGFDHSNQPLHGKINISGSSISNSIRDAHHAVLLGRICSKFLPDDCLGNIPHGFCSNPAVIYDLSGSGGIITCTGNTFLADACGVKFIEYPYSNVSIIKTTDFNGPSVTDPGYLTNNPAGYTYPNQYNKPYEPANSLQRSPTHIYQWGVKNVIIQSNNFMNSEKGILSYDAKYDVSLCNFYTHRICMEIWNTTPNFQNNHTIFNNNNPGIINNNLFSRGIAIYNGRNDVVRDNKFGDFNYLSNFQNLNEQGIRLISSGGYNVLVNEMFGNKFGIWVQNSGSISSFIGTLSNTSSEPGNKIRRSYRGIFTGSGNSQLIIHCNTHDNPNPPPEYNTNWLNPSSALANQGYYNSNFPDCRTPAGNIFKFPLVRNELTSSGPSYVYTYHALTPAATPTPVGTVILAPAPIPWSIPCCDDPCAGNPAPCRIAQIQDIENNILQLQAEYSSVQSNLDQGQTTQLITAINHNSPTPPGQLKNMLLNASPLSDEVLLAFINRTVAVTPPGIFKDVLVANSPVSENVWDALQPKLTSLAPGIAKLIRDAQGSFAVRTLTAIQRDIDNQKTQRQYQVNQLTIQYLENDSIDNVVNLLLSENTNETKQTLFGYYLDKDDSINASLMLNTFTPQSQEDYDWFTLSQMMLNFSSQGKTLFEMDSAEIQMVRTLAEQTVPTQAAVQARAIMGLVFREEFPDFDTTAALRASDSPNIPTFQHSNIPLLTIIPNPFSDFCSINYSLPENTATASINIYNLLGKKIKTIPVSKKEGMILLSIGEIENGVYLCRMEANGVVVESHKLILIRK